VIRLQRLQGKVQVRLGLFPRPPPGFRRQEDVLSERRQYRPVSLLRPAVPVQTGTIEIVDTQIAGPLGHCRGFFKRDQRKPPAARNSGTGDEFCFPNSLPVLELPPAQPREHPAPKYSSPHLPSSSPWGFQPRRDTTTSQGMPPRQQFRCRRPIDDWALECLAAPDKAIVNPIIVNRQSPSGGPLCPQAPLARYSSLDTCRPS